MRGKWYEAEMTEIGEMTEMVASAIIKEAADVKE